MNMHRHTPVLSGSDTAKPSFGSAVSRLLASLARKALLFVVMLFALSVVVFYVSRLTPGDPLQSFYGDARQPATAWVWTAPSDANTAHGWAMSSGATSAFPSNTSAPSWTWYRR